MNVVGNLPNQTDTGYLGSSDRHVILAITGQRAQLQEWRVIIEKKLNAIASYNIENKKNIEKKRLASGSSARLRMFARGGGRETNFVVLPRMDPRLWWSSSRRSAPWNVAS